MNGWRLQDTNRVSGGLRLRPREEVDVLINSTPGEPEVRIMAALAGTPEIRLFPTCLIFLGSLVHEARPIRNTKAFK